jgi:hypothetical protein
LQVVAVTTRWVMVVQVAVVLVRLAQTVRLMLVQLAV